MNDTLDGRSVIWRFLFGPQELLKSFQHDRVKVGLATVIAHLRWYVGYNNKLTCVPLGVGGMFLTQVSHVTG